MSNTDYAVILAAIKLLRLQATKENKDTATGIRLAIELIERAIKLEQENKREK